MTQDDGEVTCRRCGVINPYRWLGGYHCPEKAQDDEPQSFLPESFGMGFYD